MQRDIKQIFGKYQGTVLQNWEGGFTFFPKLLIMAALLYCRARLVPWIFSSCPFLAGVTSKTYTFQAQKGVSRVALMSWLSPGGWMNFENSKGGIRKCPFMKKHSGRWHQKRFLLNIYDFLIRKLCGWHQVEQWLHAGAEQLFKRMPHSRGSFLQKLHEIQQNKNKDLHLGENKLVQASSLGKNQP